LIRFLTHNRSDFEPAAAIGRVVWPHFDLFFVHEGRISLSFPRGKAVVLGPGDAALVYPHTPIHGRCETRASFSVQHFEVTPAAGQVPFKEMFRLTRGYEHYGHADAPGLEPDVLRGLDLARREQSPLVQQMRVAVLTLIIGQLRSAPPAVLPGVPHGKAFEPLIRWLQLRLDRPVTLNQMAAQMRLSPSHFRSLFKTQVGQSPGQFLLALRHNEARRLLRETTLPIKQIARLVGYSALIPFAHGFKKHTGRTPASYRFGFRDLAKP